MTLPQSPLVRYGLIGFAALAAAIAAYLFISGGGESDKVYTKPSPITEDGRDTRLMPRAELPPPTMEGAEQSEALVKKYPFDARVRYLRFLHHVNHNRFEDAEGEIDMALASEGILNKYLPGANLPHRYVYAVFLNGRGHLDEARAIAWPVCQDDKERLKPLRDKLNDLKLCRGGVVATTENPPAPAAPPRQ